MLCLKLMEEAGLVSFTRQGTRNVYRLRPESLSELRDHFNRLWLAASEQFVARAHARADLKKARKI